MNKLRRSALGLLTLSFFALGACGVGLLATAIAQTDAKTQTTPKPAQLLSEPKSEHAKAPASSQSAAAVASAIEKKPARNGKIAQLVGRILEQYHYNQQPFDNQMSQKMVKGYMDVLDYSHLIFLQSDLDEFLARYGNELDKYTVRADASPAFVIFQRFCERLDQRLKLVEKLLKEPYNFAGADRFTPDRSKVPFPKDDAEAEQLWRSRIKFEILQGKLTKEKAEDVIKKIARRYNNLRKNTLEMDENEVLQTYLNGLAHAYDPHSDYMTPDDAENFNINAIKLKLSGIGAVLRSDDGYAKIERLVPGGPAESSKKLKAGDRIIGVAQGDGEFVDTVDMKLNKVVDLIRGKRGTKVRLSVIPAGQTDASMRKEVVLTRDEIKLSDQFAKAQIFEHPGPNNTILRVGVINLPQFSETTVRDVAKLIERLKREQVVGIILDLRRNGGGLLDQAIDLTGLFIRQGPVVQVRNGNGQITTLRDDDSAQLYSGPLVVLVGHLSASASEIVAGALQDYNRALIVGDSSTHGKGTVQTLLPLDRWVGFGFDGDPGNLKLTVQKFYRIAGGSTQKKGVVPDITLPSLLDYMELGERTLPSCLPYDEVNRVDYDNYNLTAPYVAELTRRSAQRIAQSKDFSYVREDIELLKKRLADKSISLNEDARKKEKADLLAQAATRKQERSHRSVPRDKVYDLTLADVDKNTPLDKIQTTKVAATPADDDKEKDKDSELLEDDPTVDPQLDEAVNILVDYASLLAEKNALVNKTP